MVPLQVLWAGRSQHHASGTSLAAILPIAVVAAATYYFLTGTPQADLTIAFYLAAGGVVGALLGALAARRMSDAALKTIIAILLVAIGLKELYDVLIGTGSQLTAAAVRSLEPKDYALMAAGGFAIGVVSGLTGVGGGILVVPLLALGFGIGQRLAQGTSLVAILPTAAIGAFARYRGGDVDVRAAGWIAAGGVPAAIAGALLALWLPQRALAGLFGAFLLLAAVQTWTRAATPKA